MEEPSPDVRPMELSDDEDERADQYDPSDGYARARARRQAQLAYKETRRGSWEHLPSSSSPSPPRRRVVVTPVSSGSKPKSSRRISFGSKGQEEDAAENQDVRRNRGRRANAPDEGDRIFGGGGGGGGLVVNLTDIFPPARAETPSPPQAGGPYEWGSDIVFDSNGLPQIPDEFSPIPGCHQNESGEIVCPFSPDGPSQKTAYAQPNWEFSPIPARGSPMKKLAPQPPNTQFKTKTGSLRELQIKLGRKPYILLEMPDVGPLISGEETPRYRGFNLHPGRDLFAPDGRPPTLRFNVNGPFGNNRAVELVFERSEQPRDEWVYGVDDVPRTVFPLGRPFPRDSVLFSLEPTGFGFIWNIKPENLNSPANFFGVGSSFGVVRVLLVAKDRLPVLAKFYRRK